MHRSALTSAALTLALTLGPDVGAQNGSSFVVLSNGGDAIYSGVGAGPDQVPGLDGLGTWVSGEDLFGVSRTRHGHFGYRQAGLRETVCVIDAPGGPLAIDFPLNLLVEYAGGNQHDLPVFSRPGCTSFGIVGMTSAGYLPYGAPAGASFSFFILGWPFCYPFAPIFWYPYPWPPPRPTPPETEEKEPKTPPKRPDSTTPGSGQISFPSVALPSVSTSLVLMPNIDIFPTTTGGTATLIAAAEDLTLPIASTGLCWVVQFQWAPSAVPAMDDIDGWWQWRANSRQGNQYWCMSTDESNAFQSHSVGTRLGLSGLTTFFANVDYEMHYLSVDPVTQSALAPVVDGVYSQAGLGGPLSGNPFNGGFDLSRHEGYSTSGSVGPIDALTGLPTQSTAGTPFLPTLGFFTWDTRGAGVGATWRLTWVQIDFDLTFGLDPVLGTSVMLALGAVRLPVAIPASQPLPFPQPLTTTLFPVLVHPTGDLVGNASLGDPSGFVAGAFGLPVHGGGSLHLPVDALGACAVGLPVGVSYGSTGLAGPGGPLVFTPSLDVTSLGRQLNLFD